MISTPMMRTQLGLAIALSMLVAAGPAVAQLAMPSQGMPEPGARSPQTTTPGGKKSATRSGMAGKPTRKASRPAPARVDPLAQQGLRQPSYEDLAPQGSANGPGIRPGFSGGRPTLNMGF